MTAHKHAHLMAQYAQDALETETPWERWEWKGEREWLPLSRECAFSIRFEFRRKPKTLTHTVTIPEPLRDAPEVGESYYVADPKTRDFYEWLYWHGDEICMRFLTRGLCFATKEDAIAAAKAMMPIKGEEV